MPASSTADGGILARVRTEKDLQVELQRIGTALGDKDNWDRRVDALQELRTLVDGDISRFESCVPALSQLIKHSLEAQLADLRSAIVKEACACVRAMAHSAAAGVAEAVSDWYVKVAVILQAEQNLARSALPLFDPPILNPLILAGIPTLTLPTRTLPHPARHPTPWAGVGGARRGRRAPQ